MSDLNHYQKLEVDENASFEEIQNARSRLLQEHSSDRKQVEAIEAAYDAILMDRLRLRQEGKIKVPDRIRFPEKLVEPPSEFNSVPPKQSLDWLQRFVDTPSRADILWPAGLFAALSLLSLTAPPVALALGVGFSLYFLNRKEHKFGRAFLLTLVGLIVGVVGGLWLGELLGGLLTAQSINLPLTQETFASLVTFLLLWIIVSFLR
ncbi:MAG TPA: CPP1-like family protein [Crinalium sp.]|jgi:hypothetical protein